MNQAVWRRKPPKGASGFILIVELYACRVFRAAVDNHGLVQSMSRKGNCWDNAVAKSFFRTLKTELIYHITLTDEDHARKELFEYIEIYYNRQRLHATLNYRAPAEFEMIMLKKCV